jgi:flagellar basal-body rod protein FlgC
MFGSFDISTSALNAQRVRLDTIASNIANVDSFRMPGQASPYKRLYPIFEGQAAGGGMGVHVSRIEEDDSAPKAVFDPGNHYADAKGYVYYPNVDLSTEYINALESTRAYEANVTAIETTKSMMSATMRLIG